MAIWIGIMTMMFDQWNLWCNLHTNPCCSCLSMMWHVLSPLQPKHTESISQWSWGPDPLGLKPNVAHDSNPRLFALKSGDLLGQFELNNIYIICIYTSFYASFQWRNYFLDKIHIRPTNRNKVKQTYFGCVMMRPCFAQYHEFKAPIPSAVFKVPALVSAFTTGARWP